MIRHVIRGRTRHAATPLMLGVGLLILLVCASPLRALAQGAGADTASTIALELKSIDIFDALKILSEKGHLNIAISPGVQGRVTLFLGEIDVLDALDLVVETAGMAYVREDDVIKVMTPKQYEDTYGEGFRDRQVVETTQIRNMDVAQMSQALTQLKTPTGKLITDVRTNTIVMMDVPEAIWKMKSMIAEIDVPVTTRVFAIQHTAAGVVAQSITPLLTPSAKIAADANTNRIMITDTADNVDRAAELIALYDIAPVTESRVVALSYADPAEITAKLAPQLTPGLGSIQPIADTRSVLVTDVPQRMGDLADVIALLDIQTREVLIEAKIIRVSLSDRFRMGINWEYMESKLNDLDVRTGFNILSTGDPGVRITRGSLTEDKYTALVEALQTVGTTDLLASPRIAGVDGKESKILVGSNVPYTTTDTREENGIIRTFEKVTIVDVGTKLYVTPRIHADGFVTMDIVPEVSSVVGTSEGGIPIVETSRTETSVMVKDGVTIVLSGLIEEKETKTVNKVPLLGSIPILGYLFRSTDRTLTKSELVILLTPTIITGDVKADELRRYEGELKQLQERMK